MNMVLLIALILLSPIEAIAPNNNFNLFEKSLYDYALYRLKDYNLIEYIKAECYKCEIDFFLILLIMKTESNFNKKIISKYGAIGLMQIMPVLAEQYGFKKEDLFNPYVNVNIGIMHMSYLIKKYKSIKIALMCYLCGETFVYKNYFKAEILCKKYLEKTLNCFTNKI